MPIISNKKKKNLNNNNIGSFASINNIPRGFKKPLLVSSTDGVGTKIEIANELNKFDTIGIDLVAMSVNDLIVQGARPLVFLDYISINKINLKKLKSIIKGIVKGCDISGCELVGGETAEMPGTYEKNKFDIAGFAVGLVDQNKLLNKNKIKKNDLILAIPSSGLHSNGFSLVRYVIKKNKINIKKNNFLKKELLKPTKIYVNEILYQAKVNPFKKSHLIELNEIKRIVKYSKIILNKAINFGGSSIRDFKGITGKSGNFQSEFKVYDRTKKRCSRNNCSGQISRKIISNRSTFICSVCQK